MWRLRACSAAPSRITIHFVLPCRCVRSGTPNKLNKEQTNDFKSKLIDIYSKFVSHEHSTCTANQSILTSLFRCHNFGERSFASAAYICQTLAHDKHSHLFKFNAIFCFKDPQHTSSYGTNVANFKYFSNNWQMNCDETMPIWVRNVIYGVFTLVRCRCHCILVLIHIQPAM